MTMNMMYFTIDFHFQLLCFIFLCYMSSMQSLKKVNKIILGVGSKLYINYLLG